MDELENNSQTNTQEKIQLHVAEYNMLMSRNNNFFYINNIILGLIVTGVATLATSLSNANLNLVWGVIIGIQALYILTAWLTYETYFISKYLVTHLRPLIINLVGTTKFWEFETFLLDHKKPLFFIKAEFSGTFLYLLFILLCFFVFHPPAKMLDWFCYGLTILLFIVYGSTMLKTYRLRRNRWGIAMTGKTKHPRKS